MGAACLSMFATFGVGGCGEPTPPSPSSQASVRLEPGSEGCDAANPIAAHITNTSKARIDGVEFTIMGQEVGRSTILANSGPLKSDKIMEPGERHSICVETPMMISTGSISHGSAIGSELLAFARRSDKLTTAGLRMSPAKVPSAI